MLGGSPLCQQGLCPVHLARILIDEGFEVTKVGDAEALLAHVTGIQPDLASIDVRMPPSHTDEGIRAALEMRRRGDTTAVLLFSQYIETGRALELFRSASAGLGYLLKDRVLDIDEFLDAVNRVARGGTAIDPVIVASMVATPETRDRVHDLSPRELAVLQLMAEGLTNQAICRRLKVARRTVETHVNSVFGKLGLTSTVMITAGYKPCSRTCAAPTSVPDRAG